MCEATAHVDPVQNVLSKPSSLIFLSPFLIMYMYNPGSLYTGINIDPVPHIYFQPPKVAGLDLVELQSVMQQSDLTIIFPRVNQAETFIPDGWKRRL